MKLNIIIIALLFPFIGLAQSFPDSTRQTSGISFTPQFNYKGSNASTSTIQLYNPLNGKYFGIYSAYQSDLRYAPITGGGYVPTTRTLTIGTTTADLSANRIFLLGNLTNGVGIQSLSYDGTTSPTVKVDTANMVTKTYGARWLTQTSAASAYQPILGYTAEDVANKATSFSTINNTLYPTTQAVYNYSVALGGSYSNPSWITDLAYSKLTGTPSSLPPSGTAAGVLSGTYPNPGLAKNISLNGGTSNTWNTNWSSIEYAPSFGNGFFARNNAATQVGMGINSYHATNGGNAWVNVVNGNSGNIVLSNTGLDYYFVNYKGAGTSNIGTSVARIDTLGNGVFNGTLKAQTPTGTPSIDSIAVKIGSTGKMGAIAGSSYALPNQTMYIGTTAHALNRASASEALTGIASIDGSAAKWTTGRTLSITGDISYTSPSIDGSGNITAAGTLATVNSNTGSFGTVSSVPTITFNGKGLATSVANTPIQIAESQVTNLTTDLAGKAPSSASPNYINQGTSAINQSFNLGTGTGTGNFVAGTLTPSGNVLFHAVEDITAHAHYGFVDDSHISNPTAIAILGHASFDANPTYDASGGTLDHGNGFQSTQNFTGSGTLLQMNSYASIPYVNAPGGTLPTLTGFRARNMQYTSGTVTDQIGFYVENLTGATNNHAIYTDGVTPSYFGGDLQLGTGVIKTGDAVTTTYPTLKAKGSPLFSGSDVQITAGTIEIANPQRGLYFGYNNSTYAGAIANSPQAGKANQGVEIWAYDNASTHNKVASFLADKSSIFAGTGAFGASLSIGPLTNSSTIRGQIVLQTYDSSTSLPQVIMNNTGGNYNAIGYDQATGDLVLGTTGAINGTSFVSKNLRVSQSGDATLIGKYTGAGINITATQTTVSGSTSGNIVASMPFQGSSYKKVVIYANTLVGSATYTFPTAFSFFSVTFGNAGVTASSTTSVTVTGYNGVVVLEGY